MSRCNPRRSRHRSFGIGLHGLILRFFSMIRYTPRTQRTPLLKVGQFLVISFMWGGELANVFFFHFLLARQEGRKENSYLPLKFAATVLVFEQHVQTNWYSVSSCISGHSSRFLLRNTVSRRTSTSQKTINLQYLLFREDR